MPLKKRKVMRRLPPKKNRSSSKQWRLKNAHISDRICPKCGNHMRTDNFGYECSYINCDYFYTDLSKDEPLMPENEKMLSQRICPICETKLHTNGLSDWCENCRFKCSHDDVSWKSFVLTSGKYKGGTLQMILINDPPYLQWLAANCNSVDRRFAKAVNYYDRLTDETMADCINKEANRRSK